MASAIWQNCLDTLKQQLPQDQFETWIKPIQIKDLGSSIQLWAPNQFVMGQIKRQYLDQITTLIKDQTNDDLKIEFYVGSDINPITTKQPIAKTITQQYANNLDSSFTFEAHVQGKSNQLARAAAIQVGNNPGNKYYNPLFIYGGTGLGKTHLMQAAGNLILKNNKDAKVFYLHSERFVAGYVKALQEGKISEFKNHYRSVDVLLIDDIQFFATKKGSQEEFFHTFNQLLELKSQIIITSDCIPKELDGVEERLISRFSMGLAVPIDPPELETRMAILNTKAAKIGITLPEDVALFIAKQFRSNVRELEGALNRINADAHLTGQDIDINLARHALKDILIYQERKITIQNIQKTVAEYYNMRVADLHSKKRTQPIARARQMAMRLAKDLTNHSLPEIGDAFGGRDHTTVLHACRKINELQTTNTKIHEDYSNLNRLLSN